MSKTNNVFIFSHVDVSKHVNTKMGLNYLNWAYVASVLRAHDPKSTVSIKHYPEINLQTGQSTGRQVNYCEGVNGEGAYVTVTVTFNGASYTESLPCYDYHGQSVVRPDVMLVNKTIKRCFVKCASILTGLGISLYIDGSSNDSNQNQNYQAERHSTDNGRVRKTNDKTSLATPKQTGLIYYLLTQINISDSKLSPQDVKGLKALHNMDARHQLNLLNKDRASKAITWLMSINHSQVTNRVDHKAKPTNDSKAVVKRPDDHDDKSTSSSQATKSSNASHVNISEISKYF